MFKSGSAVLSDDGIYRYFLERFWGTGPPLVFVMLNPSTADGTRDDKTIRRCIGFAMSHGFGSIHVYNLYALRATYPSVLRNHPDPVGPENDIYLARLSDAARQDRLVVAWGNNAAWDRVSQLEQIIGYSERWQCLGRNDSGMPRHPLFVNSDTRLMTWKD